MTAARAREDVRLDELSELRAREDAGGRREGEGGRVVARVWASMASRRAFIVSSIASIRAISSAPLGVGGEGAVGGWG